jgi:hypothetical protein
MKAINTYISGFRNSIKFAKLIFLIYCFNLILALIVVIPFRSTLAAGFGQSMLPDTLLNGFDFTSISEFMRLDSNKIAGFFVQVKWIVMLYLFLNIFFAGGILASIINNEKYGLRSFIDGCLNYAFRFLKLFIYMAIFQILVAVIVYLPLVLIMKATAKTVDSESTQFYIGLAGFLVHLFLFSILLMVSYYTKIRIVAEDSKKVFKYIFKSVRFVFSHFLSVFPLIILLVVSLAILICLFFFLNHIIGTSTGLTILIMFIIQQGFIFSRVFIRIWAYSSQYNLYRIFVHEKLNEIPETEPVFVI